MVRLGNDSLMRTLIHTDMKTRLSGCLRPALFVASMLLFVGCSSIRHEPLDPAFEAARVKLMEGAITRDQAVIQPLLAPDFVWREDKAPLDEEPYDFWSRHKLWQEFGNTLREQPIQRDGLMVAPRLSLKDGYKGPRLAWRRVGNEWKLAYFYASAPAGH